MGELLIGNSLEETAFHEAGHIVIAGAVRLDLKHKGIILYEVENVADGWAFYWEDNQQWTDILMALRAGQLAQLKEFPNSEFRGGQCDVKNFFSIVNKHFPPNSGGDMWQEISRKTKDKLDSNWSAVKNVADAVLNSGWLPVAPTEHERATRKKHLEGNALAAILATHGITTNVR